MNTQIIIKMVRPGYDEGHHMRFKVKRICRVNRLMTVIHTRLGFPPSYYRLFYKGRRMIPTQSFMDLGMQNGDTFDMVLELRGS